MSLEALLVKLGYDGLLKAIEQQKSQLTRKQYDQLISVAVRELLQLRPDLDSAEAALRAAEATGVPLSAMHIKSKRHLAAARQKVTRKKATRKATRKKARKKSARKKR